MEEISRLSLPQFRQRNQVPTRVPSLGQQTNQRLQMPLYEKNTLDIGRHSSGAASPVSKRPHTPSLISSSKPEVTCCHCRGIAGATSSRTTANLF